MLLNVTRGGDVDDFRSSYPKPGIYHVLVRSVAEVIAKSSGNPGFEFEMEVLAGTVMGQQGKTFKHTVWNTVGSQGQLYAMAISTGILLPGKPKDQGGECEPNDLLQTVNAQLMMELAETESEYQGKTQKRIQVTRDGVWPIGHKKIAHVKINKSAYDLWKSESPSATSAATSDDDPLDSI